MNEITATFNVYEVFVRENLTDLNLSNVIERVVWKAILSYDGVSTTAMGEVYLDTPESSANFIDIHNISENLLIEWVLIKLGGDIFIEELKRGHSTHLAKLAREAQLKRWSTPLLGQKTELLSTLSQDEIDAMIHSITNT